MRFLLRLHREPPPDLDTIKQIQERVREMRNRLGGRDAELADLFALVKEDERPILQKVEARQAAEERLWPDQVPTRKNVEAGSNPSGAGLGPSL